MEDESPSLRGFTFAFGVAEVVGALAVIFIAIWLGHFEGGFAWHSNPAHEFNWHPVLMTLGMVFLYGNAIMTYRVFRNERKKKLKLTHAIILAVAFFVVVIGLQAVFDSHNLKVPPIRNLYSLHSWLGLTTVIMFVMQWLVGFTSFLFPGLKPPVRKALLPIHVFFGLTLFLCAVATALLGLLEKALFSFKGERAYDMLPPEAILVNCSGLLLVVFACFVVYIVVNPRFKRQSLPEDELLMSDAMAE